MPIIRNRNQEEYLRTTSVKEREMIRRVLEEARKKRKRRALIK